MIRAGLFLILGFAVTTGCANRAKKSNETPDVVDSGIVRIEPSHFPVETTLTEVRALYGSEKIGKCNLPMIKRDAASIVAVNPEGLLLQLSSDWSQSRVTDSSLFQDPHTVLTDQNRNRIEVTRVRSGKIGPTFMANGAGEPLPTVTCEVASGDTGAIWRMYTFTSATMDTRYAGYGEVLDANHKLFKVYVSASSEDGRNILMKFVSDATTQVRF